MKLNKKLLKEVLTISAPSRQEDDAKDFVTDWIDSNIKDAVIEKDDYGNMYVTKGKAENYPVFVGHLDQVHSYYKDKTILEINGWLYAMNPANGEQIGTGGDDLVGVYLCLEALKNLKTVKCFFPVEEEIGTVGTSNCDMDFFKDAQYAIQTDRRGNEDVIVTGSGTKLTSKKFNKVVEQVAKPYDMKLCYTGGLTDVVTLKEQGLGVCAINIASGYWNPHQSKETVNLEDVQNMMNVVGDLVSELGTKVWKHTKEKRTVKTYGYGNKYNRGWNSWDDGYDTIGYKPKKWTGGTAKTKSIHETPVDMTYGKTNGANLIGTDGQGNDWKYNESTFEWERVAKDGTLDVLCQDCRKNVGTVDYNGYMVCGECSSWYEGHHGLY